MAKESPDDLYEDDKWDFNDDGFGGMDNFGMEDDSEDDDRKPKGKFNSSITRSLKHVGKETAKGVAAGIAKGVSDGMPNVKSTYDLTTEAMSELSRLKYDVLDQARPIINQTKKATKELLRQAKGVIPFGIDQKIIDFIDKHSEPEEDKREISIQEQRDNNLSEMLGNIFKLQTEKAIETQKRAVVDRVIDEQLAKSRHAESVGFLGDIKSAIFYQSAFTKSVFTSYLKKDLELKLRHLYVAQDQLNVLNVTSRMLEQRLTAIAKNTSLPDSQKITATETAKKMMRESFLSNTGKKAQELFSSIVTNIKDQYVEPFLSNLEMGNMALEGVAQMFEAMNEAADSGFGSNDVKWNSKTGLAGSGTGFIGGILGTKLFRKLYNKLDPKSLKRIESYLSHGKSGLMALLRDKANGDGIISDFLANVLPDLDDATQLKNVEFANLTEGSKLTNKTVETIERVIPGFLSLQTKFLEMIATQNTNVKALSWDFAKQRFVTQNEKDNEFITNAFGSKEDRTRRLRASADRTVEIINTHGDKRSRNNLLISHRNIADDFEKFKIALATSGKYLTIDESFLDTCKIIASGKYRSEDTNVTSEDVWKYGFSKCKYPQAVASFLVMLLTTRTGVFNKSAAWELQHDILNTGDELMRSVKDTILEAERRGDVETLNRFGSRDANGNWYFDKSSYINSFTDDISVQNQLAATDEKYDRYGNRERVNEKKAGEKAYDFLKKAITGTSKGAAGTFMDVFKSGADNVARFLYNYTFGLGKTDKQKEKGYEKIKNKAVKGWDTAKNKVNSTFHALGEYASDAADTVTNALYYHMNKFSESKPLAKLLFVKTGKGRKAKYVLKQQLSGMELAEFFGDSNNKKARAALKWLKENSGGPLISPIIDGSEVLQTLMSLTEEHEFVTTNAKGKEEVVTKSAIDEILAIKNIKEREAKIPEIIKRHEDLSLIKDRAQETIRALEKTERSRTVDKIASGNIKAIKAEKPSETKTMLKVLENSYLELQYMRSYLFDIAAIKVTETSRSLEELRRGYAAVNPLHEKARNEELKKQRIEKEKREFEERNKQILAEKANKETKALQDFLGSDKNAQMNVPLKKPGKAQTKYGADILSTINAGNVRNAEEEEEQYTAAREHLLHTIKIRTSERRKNLELAKTYVDSKGNKFKLTEAQVDDLIKLDKLKLEEQLKQLDENHEEAQKQFKKNQVKDKKTAISRNEMMMDAAFGQRAHFYQTDKAGNIKVDMTGGTIRFELSDEGKFYLGENDTGGYFREKKQAKEDYDTRRRQILAFIIQLHKRFKNAFSGSKPINEMCQQYLKAVDIYQRNSNTRGADYQKYEANVTSIGNELIAAVTRWMKKNSKLFNTDAFTHLENTVLLKLSELIFGNAEKNISSFETVATNYGQYANGTKIKEHNEEVAKKVEEERKRQNQINEEVEKYFNSIESDLDKLSGGKKVTADFESMLKTKIDLVDEALANNVLNGTDLSDEHKERILAQHNRLKGISDRYKDILQDKEAAKQAKENEAELREIYSNLGIKKNKLTPEKYKRLMDSLTDEQKAKFKSIIDRDYRNYQQAQERKWSEAEGDTFINDGTKLEKYGGITDGITSILGGRGIAGEAGKETILPHKANERFKKLIFNAVAMTFGREKAFEVLDSLDPNELTLRQLGIFDNTKRFADGATVSTTAPKKERKVNSKSSTNQILLAQLDVLKEIRDHTLFGVNLDVLSKIYGDGKDLLKALKGKAGDFWDATLDKLASAKEKSKGFFAKRWDNIKSLGGMAWTGAKNIATMPFSFWAGAITNKQCAVYKLTPSDKIPLGDPLIDESDWESGLFADPKFEKKIKSTDDIKGPVWDGDGKQRIKESDIKAGLCDIERKPISNFARKTGRFFRNIIIGAVDKVLSWKPLELLKNAATLPFKIAHFLNKRNCDVYSKRAPKKMLVSAKALADGYLVDEEGNKVTAATDIKGCLWWAKIEANGEKAGTIAIEQDDIDAGLIDEDGDDIKTRVGLLASLGLTGMEKAWGAVSTVGSVAWKVTKHIAKKLFVAKDKHIDVYVRNDDGELEVKLKGKDIANGKYLIKRDGKFSVLDSAYGIDGEVYTNSKHKKCILELDDIKAGLFDEDGNKLTKYRGMSLVGAAGSMLWSGTKKVWGAIGKGVKGLGTLIGNVWNGGKDFLSSIFSKIGQGVKSTGWFLNRKDLEEVVGDRLLDIYHLLYVRLPERKVVSGDTDGDGVRDGSYEDYIQRQKERKAAKSKAKGDKKSSGKKSDDKVSKDEINDVIKDTVDNKGSFLDNLIDFLTIKALLKGNGGGDVKKGFIRRTLGKLFDIKIAQKGKDIAKKGKDIAWGATKGVGKAAGKGAWGAVKGVGKGIFGGGKLAGRAAAGAARLAATATGFAGRAAFGAAAGLLTGVANIWNPVGWALLAGTIGSTLYDINRTNPLEAKWQRVRFKWYGATKAGVTFEFAHEDYLKDLEKATFKAMKEGRFISVSELEHFGRNTGMLYSSNDTAILDRIGGGNTFVNDMRDDKANRLEYLKNWYACRFYPTFEMYTTFVKSHEENGDPDDFPDVTLIPYAITDDLCEEFDKTCSRLKQEFKDLEDYELDNPEKYKAWLNKKQQAEEDRRASMTELERKLEDSKKSIGDDGAWNYSSTADNFSQMWYNLKNWNWLDASGDFVLGVVSTITDTFFGAVKQIGNLFMKSNNYIAWADIRKEAYGISGDADIENVRQLEEVANRIWMGKRKQLTRSEIEDLIDDMLDGKESYKDFVTTAMNECETDEDTAKVIVNNYILTWFKKRFITVNKLFVATICALTGENPGDMLDVDDIPEELQGEALDKFAKDAMKFVHDAGADEFVMDTDAFSMYLFKHGIKELEDSELLKGELSNFDKFDEEVSNTINLYKKTWDKFWSGDWGGALSDFGGALWGSVKVVGRAFVGLGNYIAYKFADWFGDTVNEAQWKERFTVYNLPEPVITAIMAGNGDKYISIIEDLEEIAIKILDGETSLLDSDTRAEVIDKIHELCKNTFATPNAVNNIPKLSREGVVEQLRQNVNTVEKYTKFYLYWFKAVFLKQCALLATVIRNITHKKTGAIDVDDIPEDMSAEVLEAFLKEAKVINKDANDIGLNKESYLQFTDDSTKRNKNSATYKQEQADAVETQNRARKMLTNAVISAKGSKDLTKQFSNFKFDAVQLRDDLSHITKEVALLIRRMGTDSKENRETRFSIAFNELCGIPYGQGKNNERCEIFAKLEEYIFEGNRDNDDINEQLTKLGELTGIFTLDEDGDNIDADNIKNQKILFIREWYNNRFLPAYITLLFVVQELGLCKHDQRVTRDLVLSLDFMSFTTVLKCWVDYAKPNISDMDITPTLSSYKKSRKTEGKSKAKSDIEEKKRGNKPSPKEQREQAEKVYLADLKQKADNRQISLRGQGLFDRFNQAPMRQLDQSDVPQKYASGGIVWGKTNLDFGIAGEAGPESVIPLRNDSRFDSLISESVGMVKGRGAAEAVSNILKGKAGLNSELPSKDLFKSVSSFFKSTSGDLNGLSRILDIDKLSARDLLAGLFGLQLMNLSLMGRGSLDGKMSTVVTNKDTSSNDTSPFSKIKNMFSSLSDSIANNGIVGTISNGVSSFMGSASSVVSGIANTFTGGSSNIKPASSTRGGSDVNKANMMKIWKALKSAGWTEESIAGLLGNIQKESGIESVRMQGDLARDRSKSNKYTANCENNKQSFVRDSVGYGLCQWTYPTRKAALYDFAHERNKSIGDFDTQVEFIKHEVSSKYPGVLKQVKSCKDVVKATEIILKRYEQPAKMNDPAELRERAGYAIEIYKMLSGVSEADLDAGIVRGSGSRNDGTMVNTGAGTAGSPQNAGAAGNYQNDGSISNGDVALPTQSNVITSQFGPRNVKGGSKNHRGIDLRARTGDPIFSMMDGVVQGTDGKYNSIAIDHGNGIAAKYLHNSQILTSPGQSVHKGDVIALAGGKGPKGATQYASHLHLGISKNGQTLDPEVFLRSHGIDLKIKDGGAAHGAPASDADTIGDSGSKAEMIKNLSIVPTAASNVLDRQSNISSTPFVSHQQRNQISTSPVKAGEDMDASTVMDQQKLSELQIMANLLKDIKDILIADDKQEVSEKPQTVAKPSEDTSKIDKLITAITDLTRSISSKTDTGTTKPAPAVRPSASKERSFGFPLNIAKA